MEAAEIWKGRFVTPYINARRVIDQHVERDLVDWDTLPTVPMSRGRQCVQSQKRRHHLMLQKVYNDEVPLHRSSPVAEGQQAESPVAEVAECPEEGWAELFVATSWKEKRSETCDDTLKHLRLEQTWIDARLEEDCIVLFGNQKIDVTQPVLNVAKNGTLERWKAINRGRYFWDFIDVYGEKEIGHDSRHETDSKHETDVEETITLPPRSRAIMDGPETSKSTKFDYLPSIYPFELPQCR